MTHRTVFLLILVLFTPTAQAQTDAGGQVEIPPDVLALAGTLVLAVLIGNYQLGAAPAVWLSVLLLLGVGGFYGKAAWERRVEVSAEEERFFCRAVSAGRLRTPLFL